MALIKCPECGKDVSNTIKSCIHCGFVLNTETKVEPKVEPEKIEDKPVPSESVASTEETDVTDSGVSKTSIMKLLVFCGSLILFLAIMAAVLSTNPAVSNQELSTTFKEITVNEEITVDVNEVYDDFKKNIAAAKNRYEGTSYTFYGEVSKINSISIIVTLYNADFGGRVSGVHVYLETDDIIELTLADQIKFVGYLEFSDGILNYEPTFSINDAKLIEIIESPFN